MLQQDEPNDYVIASGETHSIREFVELAFKEVGIDILWSGSGVDEKGIDSKSKKTLVISSDYLKLLRLNYCKAILQKQKKI